MDEGSATLTVFFEDPFWVGVVERVWDGRLMASKIMFGAEPKDCEVLTYIRDRYACLTGGPEVEAETRRKVGNPKRRQRKAGKQLDRRGIGTKAQLALQRQHESMKMAKETAGKERREAERQRRFDLRQQKRKERHKGR